MAYVFALKVFCYFGFINCNTPPGVWPEEKPTVIATESPSGTSPAQSTVATTTSIRSFTPTTLASTASSASFTMSLTTTVAPTTSAAPTTAPIARDSISSNVLVIARDSNAARTASSGLNAYGIPFTTLLVPQDGVDLPVLNSSSGGNFGGIVVEAEVSYDYGDGFHSALTQDQWNQLYAYQLSYGVRMVQYDVYPGPKFGASAVGGGCCDEGVEQLVSFSDTRDFSLAGLKNHATVGTQGLWHYPATVSDSSTTKEIAQFDSNSAFSDRTTAAVINNFDGRQQMAFFIGFAIDWSVTSNYLQHAWITWVTRGLYAGHRRVNLNTQIDDMFLKTSIYKPSGTTFRITPADMDGISNWLPSINAKMNPGSKYFVEVGHNGNGNIEASSATDGGWDVCNGGGIQYDSPPDTPLEWRKPLGTGTDRWPATPTSYDWTTDCMHRDDLFDWWVDPANMNDFGHISHTFTHLGQNNATYSDIFKEISFNQAWMKQANISSARYFTSNGIIPPAITGLHNGDALRAWWDKGIRNCVGDNTRPALLNQQNDMWPYFTNFESDGFDGMQVNGRWATRIYYNCDTPDCTVQEWVDTSSGAEGGWEELLATEKAATMRHLFGLRHDGYMFHQANLRNSDVEPITINGVTAKYSIFQAWVETQVQEFVRLVDWPLVTVTHKEMSASFLDRYTRDACNYALSYIISDGSITGVTLSAEDSSCSAPIPVTFPVPPSDTKGSSTEQVGSDPTTLWVQLFGDPVTFSLSEPIPL